MLYYVSISVFWFDLLEFMDSSLSVLDILLSPMVFSSELVSPCRIIIFSVCVKPFWRTSSTVFMCAKFTYSSTTPTYSSCMNSSTYVHSSMNRAPMWLVSEDLTVQIMKKMTLIRKSASGTCPLWLATPMIAAISSLMLRCTVMTFRIGLEMFLTCSIFLMAFANAFLAYFLSMINSDWDYLLLIIVELKKLLYMSELEILVSLFSSNWNSSCWATDSSDTRGDCCFGSCDDLSDGWIDIWI